jgi:LysR family transcriptional regulator, glycine cleavage system transcriptional activator
MMKSLPPLQWLRSFESAARHLSFTHAAQELNFTQAAISKQIKLLELHVRQPLFMRLTRSLVLTKVGEAYLPKVRDALERLESGTREVFGGASGNIITIRSAVSFSTLWLVPRLPNFIRTFPEIKVRLISSVWSDDKSDEYDLDIQYGTGPWKGAASHRLTQESLVPICAAETAKRLRKPTDLSQHQLLHVIGYQQGWATWLNAARVAGIDPGGGVQCDTSLVAFGLAARKCGVALARSSLLQEAIRSNDLVAPFELAVPVEEAFHLITPQKHRTPAAKTFADWILKESKMALPKRTTKSKR